MVLQQLFVQCFALRWAMRLSCQYRFPSGLQIGASGAAAVSDLFTCCCPLPMTADDSVFISSLFLGFGSGSIGVSLNSCVVHAVVFAADTAVATLLPLSFLCSFLCHSSANASLISLLRSKIFAPCGITHASLHFALCHDLIELVQPRHETLAPNSSLSCLVIICL